MDPKSPVAATRSASSCNRVCDFSSCLSLSMGVSVWRSSRAIMLSVCSLDGCGWPSDLSQSLLSLLSFLLLCCLGTVTHSHVCCSALQCVLQCILQCALQYILQFALQCVLQCVWVLQCDVVCCSVLQCTAVCRARVMQHLRVRLCCITLQCTAVCCSVLPCTAICCSMLQCAAVCWT